MENKMSDIDVKIGDTRVVNPDLSVPTPQHPDAGTNQPPPEPAGCTAVTVAPNKPVAVTVANNVVFRNPA
jgi:hypothetical protein